MKSGFGYSKLPAPATQKEWVALLDELTALTVKARDGFNCRARHCHKQWLPVMLASGRVIVAQDCHWAHIVPRARGMALRHDLDNGITLCFKHHKQFDAFYENDKFSFLQDCGVVGETYLNLQARAHEVKTVFDGAAEAYTMRRKLEDELLNCERLGVTMELERRKVLKFYEGIA